MDELLVDFLTDSAEHLEAIAARWVQSWHDLSSLGVIDELFRRVRAISGTSGLIDLPRLQRIAGAVEGLIDRPRGAAAPEPAEIEGIEAAVQRLRSIVAVAMLARREPAGDDSELIARLESAATRPPAPTERRAYLTVFALNETFALPIGLARSAVRIDCLASMPSAPPHFVGLADLGGSAIAVVCLARRLEPTARPPECGRLAVVISWRGQTFALAVQDFGDVVEAGDADISPAPPRSGSSRAALSSQVLRSGSLVTPILDPELVFDPRPCGDGDAHIQANQPGA